MRILKSSNGYAWRGQKDVRTENRKIRGIGCESKSELAPTGVLPRQFVCGSTPGNFVHKYRLRPESLRLVFRKRTCVLHDSGRAYESDTSRSDMYDPSSVKTVLPRTFT